ncbi:putative vacuolar protein sorting protein [Sugiyamaella lignohabitans]|uniref:Putative vacuolar protein sorting protein n=1 Tax=Sugiyamaella lignohabitans TaxID=796027 RepID=A0A167DZ23_9ASCO|nr:putative vacuolar protein sorting protein [Sugiyamaella lignohabitans]ANB13462.1 putative vacuolar protein sorting protein [Sugiyamaella lignohabitans]
MEEELSVEDSIIATRARRSNAGNRLRSLLEAEEPLEDEENIFMEFEDDQEFEIKEDEDDGEDGEDDEGEDDSGNEGLGDTVDVDEAALNGSQSQDRHMKNKRSHDEVDGDADDSNFSDSDDSSIEGGDSDEDEGEKELQRRNREEKRQQQKLKQKKMLQLPTFKQPKAHTVQKAPKLKKQFAPLSENLLATHRRVSKREATVRNKQDIIERLQEQEARKANYVAPVVKKVRKMTQEEKLAEAKITEEKNTASLNYFFAQEEERKQRRRAAMLAKRVPMKSFIRYISATKLIPPKRIFNRRAPITVFHDMGKEKAIQVISEDCKLERKDEENLKGDNLNSDTTDEHKASDYTAKKDKGDDGVMGSGTADQSEGSGTGIDGGSVTEPMDDRMEVVQNHDKSKVQFIYRTSDSVLDGNIDASDKNPSEPQPRIIENQPSHVKSKVEIVDVEKDLEADPSLETVEQSKDILMQDSKDVGSLGLTGQQDDSKESEPITFEASGQESNEKLQTDKDIKEDSKTDVESDEVRVKIEDENEEPEDVDVPKILKLQGPYSIRSKNTISLVNFPESTDLSDTKTKVILFGPASLTRPHPPKHRGPCAVTGLPSKYMDPQTSIPYSSMEAYKILSLVKRGFLTWNCEFGGLYTGLRDSQRHANGVPEGFSG